MWSKLILLFIFVGEIVVSNQQLTQAQTDAIQSRQIGDLFKAKNALQTKVNGLLPRLAAIEASERDTNKRITSLASIEASQRGTTKRITDLVASTSVLETKVNEILRRLEQIEKQNTRFIPDSVYTTKKPGHHH